jgi:hypothetical protein
MRSRSYSRYRRTAAPTATGSATTQAAGTHSSRTGIPSANPTRTTGAASTIRVAASITHRSCWRSMPRARRNRTTSDPPATTTDRVVTARAAWVASRRAPPRARSWNGLPPTSNRGSNRPGASGATSTRATGAATVSPTHQRQRGEGRDPVGVSSSTRLSKASDMGAVVG